LLFLVLIFYYADKGVVMKLLRLVIRPKLLCKALFP